MSAIANRSELPTDASSERANALLRAYKKMRLIREFEERLHLEIMTGEVAGFTHLYAGQEAVAVGVCENLTERDYIISTHRGHGHCIAKGCDADAMMAEIYGRRSGLCKGKGGSMHIADVSRGMLGANGIVGAGAPIAVGAAISAKLDRKGQVSVAFSGDGACNQGTTFEAMNLAVVLKLPVMFVFENNHYSEHTGVDYAVGSKDIGARAAAFGITVRKADGCDFFAVSAVANEMIELCRGGGGPAALELDTERFFGHFEGDPQRYRGPKEVERLRVERDCLTHFRRQVTSEGILSGGALDLADEDARASIDQAVARARAADVPLAEDVLADVYVEY